MSKHHDDTTAASDPGGVTLSDQKLRLLHPELFGLRSIFHKNARHYREVIAEHMLLGDSRAAVVMSAYPLLVAAYSDDLDCAAVLLFHSRLTDLYRLDVGARLLTVNTYERGDAVAPDLWRGPAAASPWTNFMPVIADFVSDDSGRIEYRKRQISAREWRRAWECGEEYRRRNPLSARDGRPLYCAGFP
jgi:hypothetical protein